MGQSSLIYRSVVGYELLMRILYGRHYRDRLSLVAEQVPEGASVLECCCGPATLYRRYLRARRSSYIGLDVNERFVSRLRRAGIDARVIDLASGDQPLPPADVALIQASLYHFLPEPGRLIDRMLLAARERVVVSEPIRNLASSELPLLGALGRRAADPGVGGHTQRFTESSLDALMKRYAGQVRTTFTIPGGREKVYVLDAR
ncbi:MAG: methyltransferase domain-containing protein [Solirubrobacteraceae bacterium]